MTVESVASDAQEQMKAILDGGSMKPIHYRLWVLSAGGTLLDGLALAAFGIALPLIEQSYEMSPLMIGALGAAYVMGMVVGAVTGGRASDKIGRRRLFLISMTSIALIALASAFAWSPEIVLITQLLIGCAVGSEFPNSSAYVSDVMPDSTRNRMLVATIAAQAVGMLVGVGIGYALLSLDPEINAWRYFLGARSIVALLFVGGSALDARESGLADDPGAKRRGRGRDRLARAGQEGRDRCGEQGGG